MIRQILSSVFFGRPRHKKMHRPADEQNSDSGQNELSSYNSRSRGRLMPNPEKMIKYLADEFRTSVAPLNTMAKNQEIIIVQNKKIIELLDVIRTSLSGRDAE